jgi:hypothetical protein
MEIVEVITFEYTHGFDYWRYLSRILIYLKRDQIDFELCDGEGNA